MNKWELLVCLSKKKKKYKTKIYKKDYTYLNVQN